MEEKTLNTIEFDKVLCILSNFAISGKGKERCLSLRPLDNPDEIRLQLSITTQAREAYSKSGKTIPLQSIPDIEPFDGKLKNKLCLDIEEIKKIYEIIKTSKQTASFLSRYARDELLEFCCSLFSSQEITDSIECVFDQNFQIKDTASLELKSLRQSQRSLEENLKETALSLLNTPSFAQNLREHLYTFRDGRIVFQVKAESKNKIPGIVHDVSASGQTFFIEPKQIVNLNNRIREVKAAIENEIHKILSSLSAKTGGHYSEIKKTFETLTELDFIFAKAKYSYSVDACEPEIIDKKALKLFGMKNPVLMSVCDNVIENDFTIGDGYNSIIITGSNAGGKTVVLKTAALCTVMAKSGMHIPCFSAEIYPFKKIYAEIGDEQNIIQNLSTFSSHICNLKKILQNADSETFLLIDEIAAGTDPKEGACLAKAVMEEFVKKGSFSLISTHFSELKSLPYNNSAFQNASVDFDQTTLKPTYKLRIGVPGASNAFEIASNLGISQAIIENAKKDYKKDISKESEILASLQEQYSQLTRLTQEAQHFKTESETKYREYAEMIEKLNSQKRKSLSDFKKRYESAIIDAKNEIKEVLGALNKEKTRENALDSYKRISKSASKINDLISEDSNEIAANYIELDQIETGQKAIIKDLNQEVTIISLPDKNGNIQILIGQLKTVLHVSKLAKALKQKKTQKSKKYTFSNKPFNYVHTNISPKLDLRGFRVDEALLELDAYLDKASLVNLSQVQIIHGHGSGQLRHAVRDYLYDSPYAAKYRPGEQSEGGDGVTIVDLN